MSFGIVTLNITKCLPQKKWYQRKLSLPPGSYEILFTTKDCSEEQAAGIVFPLWEGCYPDYSKEDHYFSVAILCLYSLLRANGLNPETNFLLIKKIA